MRREFPALIHDRFLPTLAVVLLSLPLQACLEPTSVTCATGLVCPAGQRCSAEQNACIKDDCGDGIVQAQEVCDDGNLNDFDGCSSSCKSTEECGNNIVDMASGEICDDGNTTNGDKCSADCRSGEGCGNNILDVGEQCDDGNRVDGDNCTNQCALARCGDGIKRELLEECDTGGETDTCTSNCKLAACGDGVVNVQAGEQCDEGHRDVNGNPVKTDTATCNSNCQIPRCGDGHANPAAGEQCDPGLMSGSFPKDSDLCNFNCTVATCGDGYTNAAAGEKCDDGNNDTCGTCNQGCTEVKPAKAAEGTLTVKTDKDKVFDGAAFSIDDGQRRVTFEYDSNGFLSHHSHIRVYFDPDWSSDDRPYYLAERIAHAITEVPDFAVYVSRQNHNILYLKNEKPGTHGNHEIKEFIIGKTNPIDFLSLSGMSGGSGHDCPKDMGCKSNEDCRHGLTCQEGRCKD
jgi:cysteine-rich repeat protein